MGFFVFKQDDQKITLLHACVLVEQGLQQVLLSQPQLVLLLQLPLLEWVLVQLLVVLLVSWLL
jgi:hypothetical protein